MRMKIITPLVIATGLTLFGGDQRFARMKGVSPKAQPLWSQMKTMLGALAESDPNYQKGRETFVVSRTLGIGEDGLQFVWWKNRRRIIFVFHPIEATKFYRSNLRIVELDTGVVATERELNGSTYLVTEDWVASVQEECNQHGATVSF